MRNLTVVGLGNPESVYQWSRHNAGYMVVDAIADTAGVHFSFDIELHAVVAEYEQGDALIRLIKPRTGMNDSGIAVAAAMKSRPLDSLLVVYDDVSLIMGRMRFQFSGSAGGHHGVENIHQQLDTREFSRLKLGLGPSPTGDRRFDFVTAPVFEPLRPDFTRCVAAAAAAVPVWVELGINKAMNKFNGAKLLA